MTEREQSAAQYALARLERDLAFMRDPDRWPRYPRLPLKRREGDSDLSDPHALALLIADGRPIIYFGNVFATSGTADLERREYASFEALAADYTVD